MWVCSGTNNDSKPRASTSRASSAGPTVSSVTNMLTPKSTSPSPAVPAARHAATLPHYGGKRPGAGPVVRRRRERGGVHFGITMIPADYATSPVRLGTMVEAHGFESLWLGEHSHIP